MFILDLTNFELLTSEGTKLFLLVPLLCAVLPGSVQLVAFISVIHMFIESVNKTGPKAYSCKKHFSAIPVYSILPLQFFPYLIYMVIF